MDMLHTAYPPHLETPDTGDRIYIWSPEHGSDRLVVTAPGVATMDPEYTWNGNGYDVADECPQVRFRIEGDTVYVRAIVPAWVTTVEVAYEFLSISIGDKRLDARRAYYQAILSIVRFICAAGRLQVTRSARMERAADAIRQIVSLRLRTRLRRILAKANYASNPEHREADLALAMVERKLRVA